MILRRGVGAFVPAGTPYFRAQGPLVPTIINTIAGREFEGGKYGVTRNVLGTNPVLRGSRMRRGVRGLGATVTYCQDRPPDAATAAIIAARGDTMALVPCGGTPTPMGQGGNVPLGAPGSVTPVAPVYTPIDTGVENCALQDTACIVAAAAKQTANQQAFYQAQADYNTRVCINAGGSGYVPAGTDPVSWCMSNYGGNPNSVNATAGVPPVPPSGLRYQFPTYNFSNGSVGKDCNTINGQVMCQSVASPPLYAIHPGSLAFTNLTSGNNSALKVGDHWQISITGASPNQPVLVTGTQNGKASTTPMGTTDGNGNWSTSGTMDASTVGTWTEKWSVGGVVTGQLSFTVVSPTSSALSPSTPSGGGAATPGTTGGGVVVAPGTFDLSGFLTGSAFLGLPNWMLLAAAAGAIVLFGGKR